MADHALLGTRSGSPTRPADPGGPAGTRGILPQRVAYWHAAAVIGPCLFASTVPSPLYQTYARAWHFSPLTLTLVYATYAFGVLAAYLVGYASRSVPAVVAGLVVTHLGPETTFQIFGSIVAGIALVMAVEAWRMRPRVMDPR
jgi:hypothetical protein